MSDENKTYPSKSYYNDVRTLAKQFVKSNPSCIAAVPCHTNSTEDRGSRAIVVYLYIHTNGLRITDGFREKAKKIFFRYKVEFVDLEQEQLGESFFPRDCKDKSNAAGMTKVAHIIEKNFSVFKNRLNVTAVYPSYKISCRQETNDICIAVAVLGKKKFPVDEEIFPENAMLDGYKFDIVEGYFVPTSLGFSSEESPLRFGVGIGVRGARGAGTLGAFVTDKKDYFLLSCKHVLCKRNKELTTLEKPSEEKLGKEKPGEEKLTYEKLSDEKPGEGMPDDKMPGERKPGEEMPGEEMPDEERPDEEMPDEGMPGEGMPDEEMPDEGMPDEGMPGEGTPDDEMPGGEKPDDNSPSEGKFVGEKSPGEKRDERRIIEIDSLCKHIDDITKHVQDLEIRDNLNGKEENDLATSQQEKEKLKFLLKKRKLEKCISEIEKELEELEENGDGNQNGGNKHVRDLEVRANPNKKEETDLATLKHKKEKLAFLLGEKKLEKRISEIKKEVEELIENGDGNQNEASRLEKRKISQVRPPPIDVDILIEQPSAEDYIQETLFHEKRVVEAKQEYEEKKRKEWDSKIETAQRRLQFYESELKVMHNDKLPRCIASYIGGYQSNYRHSDLDRMFFVDAGIAKLSDDEVEDILKGPVYDHYHKYSNRVVDCKKMEERAESAKFWKSGRTTGITSDARFARWMCIKYPEELKVKDYRNYGNFKHVPFSPFCQTCTKFDPHFSNCPDTTTDITKITKCIRCQKEIPPNEKTDDESWALNCFTVKSRNEFVKPGDSGAVVFDETGDAWAVVVGTYRQGYSDYTVTSSLDITLKALNKILGKELKLWTPS